MNKALRTRLKSLSLFLKWKQRSDSIKRESSPLYRPCWSLLLDDPEAEKDGAFRMPSNEQVKRLLMEGQPLDQLTLDLQIIKQCIIDDSAVVVSFTITLAEQPRSMYDFVELGVYEVQKEYLLEFEYGGWNVVSIKELSERQLTFEELCSSKYASLLIEEFSFFICEGASEEFLDNYPDMPLYSDACKSHLRLASEKSLSSPNNEAVIKIEHFNPVNLNVTVETKTRTTLPDGVVVCGQPKKGGAHAGLKGHGFTRKLAELNKVGHNSFRVTGDVLGRSFNSHSYFIEGLSHPEAEQLIKWTDEGVGLIIESGSASIYISTE